MYVRMLEWPPDRARAVGSHMRLFVSGSAPLPAAVLEAFRERFGHVILERYQPLAFAVADAKDASAETFILVGGNLKSPGEKVPPGVLSTPLLKTDTEVVPDSATGRRNCTGRRFWRR